MGRQLISAQCQDCRCDVSGSAKAAIHVNMADIERYKQKLQEWKRRCDERQTISGFRVISGDLLMDHPEPVGWGVHCDDCNPHWNADHSGACAGCYWFSLDRCRTYLDLLSWTAHLMEKNWLACTGWGQLIYRLIEGQARS